MTDTQRLFQGVTEGQCHVTDTQRLFQGVIEGLCHETDTQRNGPQACGNISELLFFSLSLPRVAYMEFFHCAYETVLKLLQENHYFN